MPKGKKPNYYNSEDGITKMRDEFFAFHMEQLSSYKTIKKKLSAAQICSMKKIIYEKIFHPWLTLRNNSEYKEIFRVGYVLIAERNEK